MSEISSWSEICEATKRGVPQELSLCSIPYASGLNINEISFSVLCSIHGISTEVLSFLKEVLQRAYYWDEDANETQLDKGKQFRRIIVPGPDNTSILFSLNFERKLGSKNVELKLKRVRDLDKQWIGNFIGNDIETASLLNFKPGPNKNVFITNRSQNTHQVDGVACLLALMPEAISVSSRSGLDTIEDLLVTADSRPVIIVSENRDPIEALTSVLKKFEEKPSLKKLLTSNLGGVLIHERVRKTCSSCAKPSTVDSASLAKIPNALHSLLPQSYLLGRGCELCKHTGYRGSVGLTSWSPLADVDREDLASSSFDINAITDRFYKLGARPLLERGLEQIINGNTSFEEVLAVCNSVSPAFAKILTQQKIQTKSKKVETARILVVEDDEDQRHVVEALFESAGYKVSTAADGLQALEKLKLNSADLVICDLMMPQMNGVQFLNHLRESAVLSSIPVLILTAAHNPELEASLLKSGAADYCEKNVTKKVLLARVERLLNTAR